MAIDAAERRALRDAVAHAAAAGPREYIDDNGRPAADERLWKVLTDQMELAGLLVPEETGGAGAGITEVAVVLEELAANLAVVPALSSLGAASALLRVVGGPDAQDLLRRLAANEITATVAWPDASTFSAEPQVSGNGAAESGATVTLAGQVHYVVDGATADVILVPVQIGSAVAVVAVESSAPGLAVAAMTGLDLTRGLAAVSFVACPATVLGVEVDLQAALDICLVLIAAEQIGVAQRCHGAAVTWAKERIQFDRPIGQFQAIKHQLVDLLLHVELGRSALEVAVEAADAYLAQSDSRTARELAVAASMAKARCGDAAVIVADQSLHILGGIGFTWEHDAHLYLRRAKVLELLLATPAAHRARFATLILAEAAK